MKKIIKQINQLGLSLKKEIIKFSVSNFIILAAFIAAGIFEKKQIFFGIGPGFAVVFSLFYVTRYESAINKINQENLLEFSHLFGFFRIYIKNGYNVFNALEEIATFANKNLKEMLTKLLSDIDEDKTVQPFVNFAHNFNEIIIEELMISIYQMIDDGEQSNYLSQFEFIFDKFSETINEKELKKKDSRLGTISSAPLIGSCLLIIVITIGIVGILGEITNGI